MEQSMRINSLPVGWRGYPISRLERWVEILDPESPLYPQLLDELDGRLPPDEGGAMTEIIYDVDPAHVATCDKPIAACPMCSSAYRLERVDQLVGEIVGLQGQIRQRREAIERLLA